MTRTEAIAQLRAAGCVFAEEEAAVLIEAAPDAETLAALVARRVTGEPLEQVVGYADFHGVRVRLRPGVFVPRVRSSLLVAAALDHIAPGPAPLDPATLDHAAPNHAAIDHAALDHTALHHTAENERAVVVDLCCGSGALGMAVRHERPGIRLYSADLDPVAVATARDNMDTPVYQGDLFEALPESLRGTIDVLIANVPYVATADIPFLPAEARDHEPHGTLDGGADGLDVFRAVAAGAARWLAPGGVLLSEITDDQLEAATAAVKNAGLDAATITDDDLEARVIRGHRTR